MPLADDIRSLRDRILADLNAAHDYYMHNRGIVGKAYESKAGRFARYKEGEKLDIPELYHRQTWELPRKVVADISNAALTKVP